MGADNRRLVMVMARNPEFPAAIRVAIKAILFASSSAFGTCTLLIVILLLLHLYRPHMSYSQLLMYICSASLICAITSSLCSMGPMTPWTMRSRLGLVVSVA